MKVAKMMTPNQVQVRIADSFKPLLTVHKRYKVYWGGRAGGKSYAFADCLLLKARQKTLRIVCVREIQESIKDSVYQLLKDRAEYYGFDEYRFYEDRIENAVTGSKFIFKGLKDQNSQNIKSLEGSDICWCEEAQKISKKSWDVLDPTIRKAGSEIWVSMNREEENDPIWKAIAANPDERTLVVKVNYYNNPYCPEEMKYLAQKCKETNLDDYEHIWLGAPVNQGDTKLIAVKDVRKAMQNRIAVSTSPLIVGVDIARFGDDKTVLCFRKGRYCYKLEEYAHLDSVEVANRLTAIIQEQKPARIFIDAGNTGAAIYDILKDRGYGKTVRAVNFGGKAINDDRYFNKRAEMWALANDWLKDENLVQLVNDDELLDDLCSVNKAYDSKGRLQLESKANVKERIGRSPDKADAFVLTFAEPVYDNGKVQPTGINDMSIESLFKTTSVSTGW
jgi:phage terminase large subunit